MWGSLWWICQPRVTKNRTFKIHILKKKMSTNNFLFDSLTVKIGCRRADFLKWPYFQTSAILSDNFDLQTYIWNKNVRKVKEESHIYLLRGFQNDQEIENRYLQVLMVFFFQYLTWTYRVTPKTCPLNYFNVGTPCIDTVDI